MFVVYIAYRTFRENKVKYISIICSTCIDDALEEFSMNYPGAMIMGFDISEVRSCTMSM